MAVKALSTFSNQGERVHFDYNGRRSRYQRLDILGGQARTLTHYLGNVERIETLTGTGAGIVEWKRYIAGAIYTYKTRVSNCGSGKCYALLGTHKSYPYSDHLGSLDVVVNHLGSVTHSASYNAWGERRSGENWSVGSLLPLNSELAIAGFNQPVTQRGYTGHEHVDTMGLIHMNGRTYDPKLGRFLQADPFIQAAGNTQSYNRYSYVVNNPLNKTDPSGYIFHDVTKNLRRSFFKSIGADASQILVGIGSMFCGPAAPACAAAGTYDVNRAHGMSSRDALKSSAVAGISSAAFTAVGGMKLSPGEAFVAGGLVGGTMAYAQGGSFGDGFLSAGIGAAAGAYNGEGVSLAGFIVSSVAGGTASYLTGGKFGNGAASSAFSYVMTWGVKKYGPGGKTPEKTPPENQPQDVLV